MIHKCLKSKLIPLFCKNQSPSKTLLPPIAQIRMTALKHPIFEKFLRIMLYFSIRASNTRMDHDLLFDTLAPKYLEQSLIIFQFINFGFREARVSSNPCWKEKESQSGKF